jgi:hypothetical protein
MDSILSLLPCRYDISSYYNAWQISRPQGIALALQRLLRYTGYSDTFPLSHGYRNNERVLYYSQHGIAFVPFIDSPSYFLMCPSQHEVVRCMGRTETCYDFITVDGEIALSVSELQQQVQMQQQAGLVMSMCKYCECKSNGSQCTHQTSALCIISTGSCSGSMLT